MRDKFAKLLRQVRAAIQLEIDSGINELYRPCRGLNPAMKTKNKRLEDTKSEVERCKRCMLYKTRNNVVFGDGDPDAKLVFVGEAPGQEEDIQGLPFVGSAGQLLTKIINAMGLERRDVYICNAIKCRPPQNRQPSQDELNKCNPYLVEQLDIVQPKVICALGRYAVLALTGKDEALNKVRGHFMDYNGVKLIPTYHPAYLLRNPQAKKLVWQDMKKIICLLK